MQQAVRVLARVELPWGVRLGEDQTTSKARLVSTAINVEDRFPTEVIAAYGVAGSNFTS